MDIEEILLAPAGSNAETQVIAAICKTIESQKQ
mgnify:CR=1 FL=1